MQPTRRHDTSTSVGALKAPPRDRVQRGSFLLEALISVLIVALGILGLIGLQARAIQNVDDAQYRAEAAYMANALLGQMWVYDRTKLVADFDSGGGGARVHRIQGVGRPAAARREHSRQRAGGAPITQPGPPPTSSPTSRSRCSGRRPANRRARLPHQYE